MAEDDTTVDVPAQPAPEKSAPKSKKTKHSRARAKAAAKAAAKASSSASKPAAKSTAPTAASSAGALIAVYVILGILVVATSFYTGYLFGKSGPAGTGGTGTQTGSGDQTKLQIIAYSDYQCPFCSRVEPTIAQIRTAYGDKVEIIFKNFPLEQIHPNALPAAIAAECVRDQSAEKFWTYHDKLFANQGALEATNLKQYATELGLDMTKFNDCFDNKKTEGRIRADMQEAQGRGVGGTPSFWIKDELVVGALPFESFKQKIDDKLAGKPAAPAAPAQQEPAAPTGPIDVASGTHIRGDATAKVTIVEFSDFQCPFCKRHVDQTEGQIVDTYVKTGKVKIAFRNYPLPFHQNAQKAAEAAECAAKLGGNDAFWKMHDTLFSKGSGDGTGLDVASLKTYAKDLGLDSAKFDSCLDSGETAALVKKDADDGQAAGVSGTPSFVINGQLVVGAQPFSSFKTAIDAALAK